MPNGHPHRVLIAVDFLPLKHMAHRRRLHKRQQIYHDFPIRVFKRDPFYFPVIYRRQINAFASQKAGGKGQAFCRIVVAADHKYGYPPLAQLGQKPVKHLNRFCRRDRLVINVPGQDHAVCPFPFYHRQNLRQYIFLVLQKGKLI